MSEETPLVILSAGGTGGHVMPAQALAHDLIARGYRIAVITDPRGMKYSKGFGDIPIHEVKAGTLGKGILGKVKGLANLAFGILQARKIIRRLKPAVVVGFGGYPSVPGVYAAQRKKIPTILHESNAILGWANDLLAKKATHIALSWEGSRGLNDEERTRSVVTGNPIRTEIKALADKPYPQLVQDGALNILVMGGSLGASIFSEVLPEAFKQLSPENRARLNIVQQCREEDLAQVEAAYKDIGINATLMTFITDVATEITNCHLFIGRSGASTVTEMTAAGRPAIYVPLGVHKDNQQKINADTVSDQGGAWTFVQDGFTSDALLARIERFLADPSILTKSAEKAKTCGNPDAAAKLGTLVEKLINKGH